MTPDTAAPELLAALLMARADGDDDTAAELADLLGDPEHADALLEQVRAGDGDGESEPPAVVGKSAQWDESKHPRDHGKFASKEGDEGGRGSDGAPSPPRATLLDPANIRSEGDAVAVANAVRDAVAEASGGDTKDWCVTTAEAVKAVFPDAEVWDGGYEGMEDDQAHTIFRINGWFMDVTADQFGGADVSVYRELPDDLYPDFRPSQVGKPSEVGKRIAAAIRSALS